MSIQEQIAAARALAAKTSTVPWTSITAPLQLEKMASSLGKNATLLEHACGLLETYIYITNTLTSLRAENAPRSDIARKQGEIEDAARAFLAGEAP